MEGQQPPPPPPQQQPQPQQGGGEDKVLAAICYIPIIGLIMYFVKRDDPFVFFHAKQGAVLTIVWIILWVLQGILSAIFFPSVLFVGGAWMVISTIWTILYIAVGILALIGFIKAIMGQEWKMPVLGGWAEKMGQNNQQPPQQ